MLNNQPWMNCHFDYERRNLILDSNENIAVIDFQDLCIGPIGIDLAGILIDHYCSYPKQLIEDSLSHYVSIMELNVSSDEALEWVRLGCYSEKYENFRNIKQAFHQR